MKRVLQKSKDVRLSFRIDPEFTGIMLGFAHDESEGCVLKGELIMEIVHKTTVRCLMTTFSGICQVNFKIANSIGVPLLDGVENHILIRKTTRHFDESMIADPNCPVTSTIFKPGTYSYPFSFDIPPSTPQSFKGKYGSIENELSATAIRGTFSANIHIAQPIDLRRCLMDELDPAGTAAQTVYGGTTALGDILSYSASAPSMVYSEGGLLNLDLHVELNHPTRYSVRKVTCGLQEKVFYRTTGKNSSSHRSAHYDDFSFPLGCSTFSPSEQQHPEYNYYNDHPMGLLQNYNALFRLCPRVCTDNKSRLIVVQHALLVRMVIDDHGATEPLERKKRGSVESTHGSSGSTSSLSPKAILSRFATKHHDSTNLHTTIDLVVVGNEEGSAADFTGTTPSLSRSPSLSESLVGSTVPTNTLTLPAALALEQSHPFQSSIVQVTSRKPTLVHHETATQQLNGISSSSSGGHSLIMHYHEKTSQQALFHRKSSTKEDSPSYEYTLSVPIIVTSRQEYREGCVPALPDYETTVDEPPSYLASLQSLPRVPVYQQNHGGTTSSSAVAIQP